MCHLLVLALRRTSSAIPSDISVIFATSGECVARTVALRSVVAADKELSNDGV
jgi:hypothetical protein